MDIATANATLESSTRSAEILGQVFLGCGLLVCMLAGACGNLMVLIAVFREERLHSRPNYLIGSLAAADLIVSVVVAPYAALMMHFNKRPSWLSSRISCAIFVSLDVTCCTASILHLCVIAWVRYKSVSEIRLFHFTKRFKPVIPTIAGIWGSAAMLSLAPFFLFGPSFEESKPMKSMNTSNSTATPLPETEISDRCVVNDNKVYRAVATTVAFYAPLTVILIIYYKMARIAWSTVNSKRFKQARHAQTLGENGSKKAHPSMILRQLRNGLRTQIPPVRNRQTELSKPQCGEESKIDVSIPNHEDANRNLKHATSPSKIEFSLGEKIVFSCARSKLKHQADIPEHPREAATILTSTPQEGDELGHRRDIIDETESKSSKPAFLDTIIRSKGSSRTPINGACLSIPFDRSGIQMKYTSKTRRPVYRRSQSHELKSLTKCIDEDIKRDMESVCSNRTIPTDAFVPTPPHPRRKSIKSLPSRLGEIGTAEDPDSKKECGLYCLVTTSNSLTSEDSIRVKRERRIIMTLGLVIGAFTVCWLPFFAKELILPFCDSCSLSAGAEAFINWLGYFNSVLNPIIYAFTNKDFNNAFRKICCRGNELLHSRLRFQHRMPNTI